MTIKNTIKADESDKNRKISSVSNLSICILAARTMSHGPVESDAEFDARYEAYFNRPDIDGWEYRKAMGELAGMDLCPEPTIVNAALRACRRINDYALAIRTLEVVKMKCSPNPQEMWPYMLQVSLNLEINYMSMLFYTNNKQ